MLADRMMRGEEGSEFKARHGFLSKRLFLLVGSVPNYGLARAKAIAESRCKSMVGVQTWPTCRRPELLTVVPANAGTHNPGHWYLW
jgi:hypothetical protein